jgi:hypothetical protein
MQDLHFENSAGNNHYGFSNYSSIIQDLRSSQGDEDSQLNRISKMNLPPLHTGKHIQHTKTNSMCSKRSKNNFINNNGIAGKSSGRNSINTSL